MAAGRGDVSTSSLVLAKPASLQGKGREHGRAAELRGDSYPVYQAPQSFFRMLLGLTSIYYYEHGTRSCHFLTRARHPDHGDWPRDST